MTFTIDLSPSEAEPTTISLQGPAGESTARIATTMGARISELRLLGQDLIQDHPEFPYSISKASALLFPFVNRLQDGRYTFEGQEYRLPIDPEEGKSALHGLVLNETFRVVSSATTDTYAEVTLAYQYEGQQAGFPFPFDFQVTYRLSQERLGVTVTATNNGPSNFPFCVGWHPYFISPDLSQSRLEFQARGTMDIDPDGIGKQLIEGFEAISLDLDAAKLDDCYALNTSQAHLHTPDYHLVVETSCENPFMQFFTPPYPNLIAIEPTSGVSNTYNNGIGLQVLRPNEVYSETWGVEIR